MRQRRKQEPTERAGFLDEVRRQAGPWPGKDRAARLVVLTLVVVALLAGPLALGLTMGHRRPAVAAAPTAVDRTAERALAQAAAVAFVREWWLATDTSGDQVTDQLPRTVSRASFRHDGRSVPAGVDVVSARPVGERWLVTVVVWPTATTSEAPAAGTTGVYLQVPVEVRGGATSVLSLPARVGSPARFRADAPHDESISTSDPRVVAAVGFLTSWLSGRNDVERWAAPGAVPAPVGQVCTQVELLQATAPAATGSPSPQRTVIDVDVTCADGAGSTDPLSYRLTLQQVSGQWAVAAIDG